MDAALHLAIGALFEKLARGRVWLYVIPCYLSHIYIDSLRLWSPVSTNFFGIKLGGNEVGPLVKITNISNAWSLDNLAVLGFIVISLAIFIAFLRRYWKGALIAWLSWDILWVVNEVAYLAGLNIPFLHNVLLNIMTHGPRILVVHTVMLSFIGVMLLDKSA
jgi:hypothetical protein